MITLTLEESNEGTGELTTEADLHNIISTNDNKDNIEWGIHQSLENPEDTLEEKNHQV